MKLTHSKTASRRAHHRAGSVRLVRTPTGTRRRHFMDPDTGMYRGKQIIMVGEQGSEKGDAPASEKPKASTKEKAAKSKSEDTSSADSK